MVKKLLFLAGVAVAIVSCNSAAEESKEVDVDAYSITAHFDTLNYDSAHLAYYDKGGFVRVQSAPITDGSFKMEGSVDSPKMYSLIFGQGNDNRMYLFLENSAISIQGKSINDEDRVVSGSKSHSDYIAFSAKDVEYDDQMKAHYGAYDALADDDQEGMDSISALFTEIDSLRELFIESYINEMKSSVVAAYALYVNSYRFELDELKKYYNQFDQSVQASEYGSIISDKIEALTNTQIGKKAPVFTMNDAEGKAISLEQFKGSYVLIDFWASWCGPCRSENPNVVKAYNEYHSLGLEILGVSLDDNKEKWLAAVEKDGLAWNHVSDLNGWDCEPVRLYAVSSIPHSVLVDPDGVIVAKNLRGEELHQKLAELLTTLAKSE